MLIIGVILVAVAVAGVAVLVAQNMDTIDVHAFGGTWSVEMYWLVIIGVVLTAVAMIGLLLLTAGGARNHRIRRERRELAKQNQTMAAALRDRPVVETPAAPAQAYPPRADYVAPPAGYSPGPGGNPPPYSDRDDGTAQDHKHRAHST